MDIPPEAGRRVAVHHPARRSRPSAPVISLRGPHRSSIRYRPLTPGPHFMVKTPRMEPKVQVSLDVTAVDEALALARQALEAGIDWLEAGTPLILAEGLRGVRALRQEFPEVPIVADLKTMDGGYLEAEMMAKAGASMVVVMGQAHRATIRMVVTAA